MKTGFCRVHDIKYPPVLMRTADVRYLHPHGITQVDWNCVPTPRELFGWLWRHFMYYPLYTLRYRFGRRWR